VVFVKFNDFELFILLILVSFHNALELEN
jgi:hypothetical protein